jgi:ComF family protein
MTVQDWDRTSKARIGIIMQHFRRKLREIAALALPDHCQICEASIPPRTGGGICHDCLSNIHRIDHACQTCGAPIPFVAGTIEKCLHCRHGHWPANRIRGFGVYEGTLRKAVVLMKQPGSEPLSYSLGKQMGKWLRKFPDREAFDLILPTPKYWLKRIARPHNSSELLAEQIGRALRSPVDRHVLARIRSTAKQGTLLRHERAHNVKGAFQAVHPNKLNGKRLLIIDDILTSGATAAEMVSVLMAAGAKHVEVACLARGIGQGGA